MAYYFTLSPVQVYFWVPEQDLSLIYVLNCCSDSWYIQTVADLSSTVDIYRSIPKNCSSQYIGHTATTDFKLDY